MQLKKRSKDAPESTSRRRPLPTQNPQGSFSYYSSNSRRPSSAVEPATTTPRNRNPKNKFRFRLAGSHVSIVIFVVVAAVCLVKMLSLSSTPNVIITGSDMSVKTYLRPTETYTTAASKLLASDVWNKSKITVDTMAVQDQLQKQFPEIQTVSVGIPLISNRPRIYLVVAKPSLVLQTNDGLYAVNANGLVLSKLSTIPNGIAVVHDQSGLRAPIGSQAIPAGTVAAVQTITYQLSAAHISYTSFTLSPASAYEIDIALTGKPYIVRYSLQASALQQSGALIATLGRLGTTTPQQYIDIRVPGRVYYK